MLKQLYNTVIKTDSRLLLIESLDKFRYLAVNLLILSGHLLDYFICWRFVTDIMGEIHATVPRDTNIETN